MKSSKHITSFFQWKIVNYDWVFIQPEIWKGITHHWLRVSTLKTRYQGLGSSTNSTGAAVYAALEEAKKSENLNHPTTQTKKPRYTLRQTFNKSIIKGPFLKTRMLLLRDIIFPRTTLYKSRNLCGFLN